MKIDVFDTYVTQSNGERMHFDVFIPKGSEKESATIFAMQWLKSIGLEVETIRLESCEYCHSAQVSAEVEQTISDQDFAFLQMEGCPSPAF